MTTTPPKVKTLSLEQFTAFERATFEFCPGINVLIGANATGKSHVMKVMYVLLKISEFVYSQKTTSQSKVEAIRSKLGNVFRSSINDIVRFEQKGAFINLEYGSQQIGLAIEREDNLGLEGEALPQYTPLKFPPDPIPLIYLPAQEFLSINEGFIGVYTKRELPYDETYYDLGLALNALPLRPNKIAEMEPAINFLRNIIAGTPETETTTEVVTQEKGRFKFFLPEGELDVHLVAEGYRKLATLLYLLRNGSLTKDSILFWDEPEANLNPKLIVKVVKVLQMLAAAGMQIFVTTHDYLLSQELSLLAEYPSEPAVDLKFFALHKPTRIAGVEIETGRTLAELEHNPILEEFAAHYDRETNLFYKAEPTGEPG